MKITRPFAGFLSVCALSALPLAAHADTLFPDTTYGTLGNGAVIDTNVGAAHSIVLLAGNKHLVSNSRAFGLSRYNSNGSLDTTFGTSGRVTTNFYTTTGYTNGLAVQSDDKILAVGATLNAPTNGVYQPALARYTSSGVIDSTFSADGKTAFATGALNVVAVQSDGKILTAGLTDGSGLLARFNADGTADSTFGYHGRVIADLAGDRSTSQTGTNGFVSLAFLPDGRFVTTGAFDGQFVTCRYNTDGSLDTTFGTSGVIYDRFGVGAAAPTSIGVFGSGKVVVVGRYSTNLVNSLLAYARYNSNGTLDTTFGTGGHVSISLSQGKSTAYAVKVLQAGKILVSGESGPYGLLARVNIDGTPDTTFNANGYYIGGVDSNATFCRWLSFAVQGDGKILTVGTTGTSDENLAMARTTVTVSTASVSNSPSAPNS